MRSVDRPHFHPLRENEVCQQNIEGIAFKAYSAQFEIMDELGKIRFYASCIVFPFSLIDD